MANYVPKAGNKIEAAHNDGIWAVHWSHGNVLTGSLDGTIKCRDKDLIEIGSSSAQKIGVTSVIATSDGNTAVACYQDAVIRFFNIQNGMEEIAVLDPGLLEAWTVCLSPHDDVLVSGTQSGAVNIWSMSEGHEKVTTLQTNNKFILSTAFSSDLKLATSGLDGFVNVFDINTQQIIHKVEAHALPSRSVAFSPDGNLIYSASDDRHICVYDAVSGAVVNTFSHSGMCLSVDSSSDYRHFAVGCANHSVAVWDLGMQRCIHTFDSHADQVWGVKFDDTDTTGKRFASVGDDSLLQIYE